MQWPQNHVPTSIGGSPSVIGMIDRSHASESLMAANSSPLLIDAMITRHFALPVLPQEAVFTGVLLVLGTAVIMPDLASLDDVTYWASSRVTICSSGSGQFDTFSFPATETEYRRSKNRLHVLTRRVEPSLELVFSTPSGGQRRRIEGSMTELLEADDGERAPTTSVVILGWPTISSCCC
ncbi:hypothetical protein SprV_0501870600 [Sparganum proliferum]